MIPTNEKGAPGGVPPWIAEPVGDDVALMVWATTAPNPDLAALGEWDTSRWPEHGCVQPVCGLLDGLGNWSLVPAAATRFIVFKVRRSEVSWNEMSHTCAAARGWIVYSGPVAGALNMIQPVMAAALAKHPSIARGFRSDDDVHFRDKDSAATIGQGQGLESEGDLASLGGLGYAASIGHRRMAIARSGHAHTSGLAALSLAYDGDAIASGIYANAVTVSAPHPAQMGAFEAIPHAAVAGPRAVAAALGHGHAAKAAEGGAIVLVEYGAPTRPESVIDGALQARVISIFASKVGENGIREGVFYRLQNGKPVEFNGASPSTNTH